MCWHPPARDYIARRKERGNGQREALRALKRRLSDVIYHALQADEQAAARQPDRNRWTPRPGSPTRGLTLEDEVRDQPATSPSKVGARSVGSGEFVARCTPRSRSARISE